MIIYEVSLKVSTEIEEVFRTWLFDKHINDILGIDGFLAAKVEEVSDPVSEDWHILVRYEVRSELDLFNYLELNAPVLRQEGIDLFGPSFSASRKILKRIKAFDNPNAVSNPHSEI